MQRAILFYLLCLNCFFFNIFNIFGSASIYFSLYLSSTSLMSFGTSWQDDPVLSLFNHFWLCLSFYLFCFCLIISMWDWEGECECDPLAAFPTEMFWVGPSGQVKQISLDLSSTNAATQIFCSRVLGFLHRIRTISGRHLTWIFCSGDCISARIELELSGRHLTWIAAWWARSQKSEILFIEFWAKEKKTLWHDNFQILSIKVERLGQDRGWWQGKWWKGGRWKGEWRQGKWWQGGGHVDRNLMVSGVGVYSQGVGWRTATHAMADKYIRAGRLWRIQLGIYANTKYCSRFCIWNQALKILLKASGLTFCKLLWSIFLVADTCCKNERKIFQLRNAFWRCLIKMPLVMPLSKNKKPSPSLTCLYLCVHIWCIFF